ncbi:MAG: hypothetical protein CMI60_21120 [Parvibaculum sp.]|nr:hypothetical protein [Parvibaculum sp.]
MATSISMCSNALLMIGHGTISSFTEGGSGAEVASNLYDSTFEALLTTHRWRFASAKSQLGQLTDTPLNDFDYAYSLPSGYLFAIKAYPDVFYEIYENNVYTNSSSIALDYIFKPDESRLPSYFVKTLEYDLASQFAIPVTGNRSLAEIYTIKFENQLKRSKYVDSQSRPQVGILDAPFIEVRA